jgi:hypothetical protein
MADLTPLAKPSKTAGDCGAAGQLIGSRTDELEDLGNSLLVLFTVRVGGRHHSTFGDGEHFPVCQTKAAAEVKDDMATECTLNSSITPTGLFANPETHPLPANEQLIYDDLGISCSTEKSNTTPHSTHRHLYQQVVITVFPLQERQTNKQFSLAGRQNAHTIDDY